MTQITANRSAIPPTTPPTIAAVLIVGVMLGLEVGDDVLVVEDDVLVVEVLVVDDDVPVVLDILVRGKPYVEGTKASYLVPPSTRNTSKDSRRTWVNSEL